MLIRYGYEITLTCQQQTALVCLLSVHEDRAADITVPETKFTNPELPVSTYRDLFGNRCRRLVAPAGDLTMWGDTTIRDSGQLDRMLLGARELAVWDLPDDCLVYLMGSRYCETDRLSQMRRLWIGQRVQHGLCPARRNPARALRPRRMSRGGRSCR